MSISGKHILSIFSTFATGGPQIRFCALANHFGPAIRHSIIAMDGNLAAREKLDPGLDVTFPDAGLKQHDSVGNIRRIIHCLRQQNPDLLITSNWGSMDWALARNLTRTGHVHMEDGFGPEERITQRLRRVLIRRIVLRGSDVIVPSQTLLKIATDIWRLPPKRLHYVPNGIDTIRFRNARPASLPAGTGQIIGTIAALRPEKNLARLLRAFRLVRAETGARLIIVGEGPERAGLERLAGTLGIAAFCHFAGHTNTPEAWHAAFDVFALSSDTEQMPLSIIEAMAAGLPVVATDVGDVRAMLAAENSPYLVPCTDESFANAMHHLLTDANAPVIGAANRAKAQTHFSDARMFAAYQSIINKTNP